MLRLAVAAMVVTLLGRLWFLQVVNGERYVQAAADVRIRSVTLLTVRGRSSTWPGGRW